jgi:hypothetical protein
MQRMNAIDRSVVARTDQAQRRLFGPTDIRRHEVLRIDTERHRADKIDRHPERRNGRIHVLRHCGHRIGTPHCKARQPAQQQRLLGADEHVRAPCRHNKWPQARGRGKKAVAGYVLGVHDFRP